MSNHWLEKSKRSKFPSHQLKKVRRKSKRNLNDLGLGFNFNSRFKPDDCKRIRSRPFYQTSIFFVEFLAIFLKGIPSLKYLPLRNGGVAVHVKVCGIWPCYSELLESTRRRLCNVKRKLLCRAFRNSNNIFDKQYVSTMNLCIQQSQCKV